MGCNVPSLIESSRFPKTWAAEDYGHVFPHALEPVPCSLVIMLSDQGFQKGFHSEICVFLPKEYQNYLLPGWMGKLPNKP